MTLLEKLKGGKAYTRTVKFPGTDQDVTLMVLSNAEIQEAVFATNEHFKRKKVDVSVSTAEAFEDENTTQILARALRDPEDLKKPFAKDANELRSLLTTDEKDILADEYNSFAKEVSPSAKLLSEEEMGALFEELKKNPMIGTALNSVTLKKLIVYLASLQAN